MSIELTATFVNVDLTSSLLGLSPAESGIFLKASSRGGEDAGVAQYQLSKLLQDNLANLAPLEISRARLEENLRVGQLVEIQQKFYFKRTGQRGMADDRILMHKKLESDPTVEITASIDPKRFAFGSTDGHLSGHKEMYILAVVIDISKSNIEIRPALIGWRAAGLSELERKLGFMTNGREVFPSSVDQFAAVGWQSKFSDAELTQFAAAPELEVKRSIAWLLGEPHIPKDWGGEKSDLFTTELTVGGKNISSAWLLKGRSVKSAMTIADLGKRGDQIGRLFTEPAGLYVLQSNQRIVTGLREMLERYAYDPRNPSLFMVIDGLATARILAHVRVKNPGLA